MSEAKPENTGQPPSDQGPKQEEQRIDQLEQRQNSMDSKLDRILDRLGGGGKDQGDAGSSGQPARQDPPADRPGQIQDQMAEAIRAVRAEEKAEEARRQHDADHQRMKPPQETAPREVTVRGKARLQRALFGGEPSERR